MAQRKKTEKTIRNSIRGNNSITIFLILVIVICAVANLVGVDICQNRQQYYADQASDITSVQLAQQQWLFYLNDSIYSQKDFDGLSADNCAFGKWSASVRLPGELSGAYNTAVSTHKELHELAAQAVELSKTDVGAGAALLNDQLTPQFFEMAAGASQFQQYFSNKAASFHSMLVGFIIFAFCSVTFLFVVAAIVARKLGDRLSKKISDPIVAVAKWSQDLSSGSAELGIDSNMALDCDLTEVDTMITSFKTMAESIEENVRVVQKVADGDMTAFVNIRSASDSLGKNLYRMVQSNDIMFAEITEVAQTVAQGARNISQASASLADSCNVQAGAVQQFRKAIEETSSAIHSNNEQSAQAKELSSEIHVEVQDSTEKMSRLLKAVGEIRQASEKVSGMIATIEEISSQTNLLALNAAIEAARAGVAGKGFAVVADEVKNLAAKSTQAADESKRLVEDTIKKAVMGDTLSHETSESFEKITQSVEHIISVTDTISRNSVVQASNISLVEDTIHDIAGAIDANAAASQETAAQSQELLQSSDALKEAMNKFNLRKRTPGKPYIPPEKQNDPEFIRQAEENYQKALREGKVIAPDPNGFHALHA